MRICDVLVRGPLGIGSAGIRIPSPLDAKHVITFLPYRWPCTARLAANWPPALTPTTYLPPPPMFPVSPENRVQITHLAGRETVTATAAVIDDDRPGIGFCFCCFAVRPRPRPLLFEGSVDPPVDSSIHPAQSPATRALEWLGIHSKSGLDLDITMLAASLMILNTLNACDTWEVKLPQSNRLTT